MLDWHLGIGPVDPRVIAIGIVFDSLEIIADHELPHATGYWSRLVCMPIQSGRLSLGQASW